MNGFVLRMVVLISGNGSNLQAILNNIAAGNLRAEVAAVISDRADAGGLKKARRAGVPCEVVARAEFNSAAEFHSALLTRVQSFNPDLIALAGFMRILPPSFVRHFARQMLNIHPSLLPNFKGLNTHARALQSGARWHGATVHIVTEQLDDGEIVKQARVKVTDEDDATSLCARVLVREHWLYSHAIKRWAARNHEMILRKRAEALIK